MHTSVRLLDEGMALVVLLIASSDRETASAVGRIRTLVMLDIARASKSGSEIHEIRIVLHDESTTSDGHCGSRDTTEGTSKLLEISAGGGGGGGGGGGSGGSGRGSYTAGGSDDVGLGRWRVNSDCHNTWAACNSRISLGGSSSVGSRGSAGAHTGNGLSSKNEHGEAFLDEENGTYGVNLILCGI